MIAQRFLRSLHLGTRSLPSIQQRFVSLLHKQATSKEQIQEDLDHAIDLVKSHDPAGYLPGRLLPSPAMQTSYYAVRSFWVESGLRIGSTAQVLPNATPLEHLEWWQKSLDELYVEILGESDDTTVQQEQNWKSHPTLRLLHHVIPVQGSGSGSVCLSKQHFDDVLHGRRNDLNLKQYPTLQHLEDHAALSCGSLSQLVLESGQMTLSSNPVAHRAARLVGMGHGLTNALRTSIPVISTTGKLIVPQDLCEQYGVKSPRYLLSALGQGDTAAKQALNQAVRDIALRARQHLEEARGLRGEVIKEDPESVSVLLPALASEAFLKRLEESGYDLTDRNLRNIGNLEHAQCALRMVLAYYQKKY